MSSPQVPNPAAASNSDTTKRFTPLVITIAVVIALVVVFFWFTNYYADYLWYDQLGFQGVLLTRWIASAVMFVIGFVAMAVPLYLVTQIAYRTRPVYAKLSQQLNEYQKMLEPVRRAVFLIVPIIPGVLAGMAAANAWPTVLAFLNSTPFGQTDPLFGLDVSFYVFQLPFWRGVAMFASAALLVSLVLAVAVSYLYGGIRITGNQLIISKATRILVAVVAGLFVLLQGVNFWLDRYDRLTQDQGRWAGALYTDVHANIPGLTILAGAAVVVALLFFFAAIAGSWRLPAIGVGSLVVVGLVVTLAYPWGVQQLQVGPNEQQLETEYIQHNIDATRTAYGVDDVEVVPYAGVTTAEPGQLRQDAATAANIRILDPALVSPTYAQFEQEKAYYAFPKQLDVDRYTIDGKTQDAVMSVREINIDGLGADAQSWVNRATVYTHGYGLVAGYGNQRGPDGQPLFFASGMPQQGQLREFEPRVYFGENSPEYSVVGAPEGSDHREFDHVAGDDGAAQTYTTFRGEGGPSLGNWFNRIVYAVKFRSEQILLSDAVNEQSQILYDRNPAQRVQAAAPYLTLDSNVYASVVDGRIVWIVDGYTTTNNYPYSSETSVAQAIADTNTPQQFGGETVNYMRNSIKATVDAYDGSVTLYAWDENDPILQTWQKVYPATVKPVSEMSGDLLSHVRYPEDLFKVQRSVLATYHVTDANQYYNQNNAWQLPSEPTWQREGERPKQPPYYMTMRMPGHDPAFSLYSTYIPYVRQGQQSRNVLTGYLSANADAGSTDGKVSEDYGRLTLLNIQNDSVNGPGQVQNIFNSNNEVATELNLLERGGQTRVRRGNLLTLPMGDGFLYVQPVYVESTGETSYPLLRRVLVAFGDNIAFESTLDEALDKLFGGDSGTTAGDSNAQNQADNPDVEVPETGDDVPADPEGDKPETPEATEKPSAPSGDARADLEQALNDASKAFEDRTKAYENNDLVGAAEADKRMTDALERAAEAEKRIKP
ncbi:UPF0182 family protein [Gulosibacter hominis]|uniref:UPF0182 family membrane protein n=1 Tax=Gulosibacter hominis TaxID=2770504 RepID=UPI001E47DF52|nr:UPF0182 family protein [Gulosibacter hominis]